MKKVHRFIGDFDLTAQNIFITNKEFVAQMVSVLKFKEGEKILLCDGNGNDAEGVIVSLNKKEVAVAISNRALNNAESEKEVYLFSAVLKGDNFDLLVQKATEVGVSYIIPIITERTVKQNLNYDRLSRIAREAAELSGRGRVPTIETAMNFSEALGYALMNTKKVYFFDQEGIAFSKDIANQKISLFIGPEGGWNNSEQKMASDAGCIFSSLGKRVLRGETAGIIASYLASL